MIERRVNGELCNGNGGLTVKECTDKSYYRDPSLYRLSGDFVILPSGGPTPGPTTVLSKEAKTATNKLTRDCRRRHSLSGGGEILSLVYPEKSMSYFDAPPDGGLLLQDPAKPSFTTPPIIPSPQAGAITSRTGILESHV